MKVMVLGIRGMPNVQGGIETHAEQLYPRLCALGCEVEAIVRTPYVPRGTRSFGPVRLRRLWAPTTAGFETFVHSLLGVFYAGLKRPDILHVHGVGPAIVTPVARLLGLRVVVTHHGPDYEREKWGRLARYVLRTGERVGMQYANARIVISRVIAEHVRSKYRRESHQIPNGVAIPTRKPAPNELQRFGLEPGKYFLQVSRMVPEKRQLDLIRAYSTAGPLPWRLALVGKLDGSEYARRVETAAAAAGVVLTGFLSGEPLRQLYANAGTFVLPSSHEGLPIVILEALSHGTPVVMSDIPANLEIGLNRTNYFPLGDLPTLKALLTARAQQPPDEGARDQLRAWVAEKYNWDAIAQGTFEIYSRLCVAGSWWQRYVRITRE
jgi:glycosyltransferase involved in cell wall biosynthesis